VAQFSLVTVTPPLLAVPNVSEGRDRAKIARLCRAVTGEDADELPPTGMATGAVSGESHETGRASHPRVGARLIDVHFDPDHDRSVFTFSAPRVQIADAMLAIARAAVACVDVMSAPPRGRHPHVGALDVAPVVYLDEAGRGPACAEALVIADRLGSELDVPVFLYGELAAGRSRAQVRAGGVRGLELRLAAAERGSEGRTRESGRGVRPDFGPARLHPTAGATLVAAREPLVAFNLTLTTPAGVEQARGIAAAIRDGGEAGLPGVRALGIALSDGSAQVTTNVERPLQLPLADVVRAVARRAPVASVEIVGLAPVAAIDGLPEEIPLIGFDPERQLIENALRSLRGSGTAQATHQAPRQRGGSD
jgi:glutamate formiminotransferase